MIRHRLFALCLLIVAIFIFAIIFSNDDKGTQNLSEYSYRKPTTRKHNSVKPSLAYSSDEDEAARMGYSLKRYRELRSKAAKANQEMIDAGMIVSSPSVSSFRLLGANLKVTDNALEAAGLDPSERDAVQAKIDKLWKDMSAGMAIRVRANDVKSNPSKGIYVFNIPANPELGNKLLSSLKSDLEQKYGVNSAQTLVGGFQTMQHFGNFGKLDIEVKFQRNKNDDKLAYDYIAVDSKTGKSVVGGSSDVDRIQQTFGDIFDVSAY
jgi:hypothetical protein